MVTAIIAFLFVGQSSPILGWTKGQIESLAKEAEVPVGAWQDSKHQNGTFMLQSDGKSMKMIANLDSTKKVSVSESDLELEKKVALGGQTVWSRRGPQWRVITIDYSGSIIGSKGKRAYSHVRVWFESRILRGIVDVISLMDRGYVEVDHQKQLRFAKHLAQVIAVRFGSH